MPSSTITAASNYAKIYNWLNSATPTNVSTMLDGNNGISNLFIKKSYDPGSETIDLSVYMDIITTPGTFYYDKTEASFPSAYKVVKLTYNKQGHLIMDCDLKLDAQATTSTQFNLTLTALKTAYITRRLLQVHSCPWFNESKRRLEIALSTTINADFNAGVAEEFAIRELTTDLIGTTLNLTSGALITVAALAGNGTFIAGDLVIVNNYNGQMTLGMAIANAAANNTIIIDKKGKTLENVPLTELSVFNQNAPGGTAILRDGNI